MSDQITEEQQAAFDVLRGCMEAENATIEAYLADTNNTSARKAWEAANSKLTAAMGVFEKAMGLGGLGP